MKSRIYYILTAVCVLIAAVCFSNLDSKTNSVRVLQHKTALPTEAKPEGNLVSHLPLISINTDGQTIPGTPIRQGGTTIGYETGDNGELQIMVSLSVTDNTQGWNTTDEIPSFSGNAEIRYHGNSSRFFDKKSYFIQLSDQNGEHIDQSLLGMTANDEWVLNGPFLDRTMIRNYLCYSTAGMIMDYAPNVRYCELILNGEYQGLYLLTEAITVDDGRIELTNSDSDSLMTGWLVRLDREQKADILLDTFSYYTYRTNISAMDLLYPGKNTVTDNQITYAQEEISSIERAIYSADFNDPTTGVYSYIDKEAFAQYFVINEFFGNVDAGNFSTYFYKDLRGKVKPVVWDFNNACDNYIDDEFDGTGFTLIETPWFERLIYDKEFTEAVIKEYYRLRQTYLSTEYITEFIDDTVEYLGDSVDRNYQVWGYVFNEGNENTTNYLITASRNYYSYEESVEQLKSWITLRGEWLDENIETLRQYCAESKNANRSLN